MLHEPNILILGTDSFLAIKEHASLIDKMKYSQLGIVTEDLISAMISTKNNKIDVFVGKGMYQNTADVLVDLWGDVAILAYVSKGAAGRRSKYYSSFGYNFVMNGYPMAARRQTDYGLTTGVMAAHMYKPYIVSALCGYLYTNTKA